jgi:hypothetical protein
MAITFRVDDVEPVRTPLPSVALETAVAEAVGVALVHVSHEAALVDQARDLHPMIQAVHLAFAEHRPLTLSPDHVWLTLAQGFAIHVDQHAEALRRRFVRHDGRAEILVDVLDVPRTSAEWTTVIAKFGDGIAEHVGPGMHRLLSCAFSTTTERERVAGEVVMMSAFRRYFDYTMRCICGIPQITLEGSAEDWAEIQRRVDVLAEYDLAWWAGALRPVLDAIVSTARGTIDSDFWQCIYKPTEVYGGEIATGWIMRLFPYLVCAAGGMTRNDATIAAPASTGRARWITPGISPTSVPVGVSRAALKVIAGETTRRLSLFGGFAGVRQLDDGALRPEVCWAVGESPRMTTLVDRILTEHEARPPAERDADLRRPELPAELVELYERCDGAVLFGRWNLARAADLRPVIGSTSTGFLGLTPQTERSGGYSPSGTIPVLPICTLEGDPRFFGLYQGKDFVVLLCDPRRAEDPEEMVVVAADVETFLERIFEHEGASWFEGIGDPTLYDHLSPYHDHLRRALTVGPHAPPTDLDRREQDRLVMLLCWGRGSEAQRAFWWEALRGATGTTKSFADLFGGKRRVPIDVMRELGMR